MAKSGIPLDQWSGASATNELHETIKAFNETASTQTRTLVRLTWALVGLTVVLVLGLAVQIVLAL